MMQKSYYDPSVINQLKDKIIDAKNNLNGAEKLQNARNNVKHILENLEHLNNAQKMRLTIW